VAACGGNDNNSDAELRALPKSAQRDAADEANADTLAEAVAFARTDRDSRACGLPSLYGDIAQATAASTSTFNDRFQGMKQTSLVASNANFGAAIVEPLMKNPWGIAIRPAGLGGHFWPGARARCRARQQPVKSRRFGTWAWAAGQRLPQISVCSEISSASSTSMPRYLTVDSNLEWPSSSCTARRFLVRR
jgi:hypothetical protein